MAIIGLLNIYTNGNLKYSWRRLLKIVAKSQGHGTNHMTERAIEGFLKAKDVMEVVAGPKM